VLVLVVLVLEPLVPLGWVQCGLKWLGLTPPPEWARGGSSPPLFRNFWGAELFSPLSSIFSPSFSLVLLPLLLPPFDPQPGGPGALAGGLWDLQRLACSL
jgi:hypothetical protein